MILVVSVLMIAVLLVVLSVFALGVIMGGVVSGGVLVFGVIISAIPRQPHVFNQRGENVGLEHHRSREKKANVCFLYICQFC